MENESGHHLRKHQFFITPAHPCSYLPEREAVTLFLDPRETVSEALYGELTDLGFRRSGAHLYRPHCQSCSACVPVRIRVADFKPRRRQRRNLARNADLRLEIKPATFEPDIYALYERYIAARHRDGDMYPANVDQFRSFLLSSWANTAFYCAYARDASGAERLVSCAAMDRQANGYSAIYTFFDPNESERGLGVFSILSQIELCREQGLPYLYLGYWIKDSAKMSYKADYRPLEMLVNEHWIVLR
ncbi:MAG: arginyltransferase [Pseudomonadota bacterium]